MLLLLAVQRGCGGRVRLAGPTAKGDRTWDTARLAHDTGAPPEGAEDSPAAARTAETAARAEATRGTAAARMVRAGRVRRTMACVLTGREPHRQAARRRRGQGMAAAGSMMEGGCLALFEMGREGDEGLPGQQAIGAGKLQS
jgi:hypothetical protein